MSLVRSIVALWGLLWRRSGSGGLRNIIGCLGDHRTAMGFARSDAMSGEARMKDARLKATSGALAQVLAVTAMLVIAGVVFYVR